MSISLRADRVRRLCLDALLTAAAMMLSYLEAVLPLNLLIPLPGFKLGLANLITLLAFVLVSKVDAALISGLRIALMGMIFGSATSLWFSVLGGIFAYLALLLASFLLRRCSLLGVSVFCAAAHNLGQCLAAAVLFGTSVLISYLPVLLLAAVLSGTVTGALLLALVPAVRRAVK